MGFPARRLRRLWQHDAFRELIRENTVQNTAKSLPQVAGIHLDTASVQPQNHPVVANPPRWKRRPCSHSLPARVTGTLITFFA